jgi:hypothetical protein
LDRELLGIRAKLIDLAAALDRVDRGEGSLSGDPRTEQIRRSLHALLGESPGRAEQILAIFSLPCEEGGGRKADGGRGADE